jgi:predicted SAM-dependent methyltransferase
MRELLLGCGSRTKKDLYVSGLSDFHNLVRLDINSDHKPDVVWDLTKHPLPFASEEFDEIHAYEVLEHLAQQGDYEFFFREFTEYWRILKPGGLFMASCPAPSSVWAFGDPSHKRIVSRETLVFLSQDEYKKQAGVTSMSDFRYMYKADFKTIYAEVKNDTTYFILRKC